MNTDTDLNCNYKLFILLLLYPKEKNKYVCLHGYLALKPITTKKRCPYIIAADISQGGKEKRLNVSRSRGFIYITGESCVIVSYVLGAVFFRHQVIDAMNQRQREPSKGTNVFI